MNWKKYQNELIVVVSFLVMLGGYFYKMNIEKQEALTAVESKQTLADLKEVIALRKLWSDKRTSQRVEKLKAIVPLTKVKWSNKSKKLKASYKNLTAREINTLISKILTLPIEYQS